MNIRAILVFTGALLCSPAVAQSVVSLDIIDLNVGGMASGSTVDETVDVVTNQATGQAAQAEDQVLLMRDCLFDSGACESTEYGGSTDIKLGDIYNLGVIDRNEMPPPDPESQEASIPLPSIDLEIQFGYDSDDLTPTAYAKLASLADVLTDPRMQDQRLVFIGHTDAVGSESYNLKLSQRRANAVASYVSMITGLPPSRIAARGVGYSMLKNTWDPASAENRRVQLVLVPLPTL